MSDTVSDIQRTIMNLEAHIIECDRVIERLVGIRSQIYKEIDNYLYVIERQKARCQSNLGVLEKANGILGNEFHASKKGWREEVLFRDHFTCQRCSSTNELTVHHIIPKSICSDELQWDVSNGITLCQACHNEWHTLYPTNPSVRVFINWLGDPPR